MGREIRMVPEGWEHPKSERGGFQPMHDCSYQEKAQEWWDCATAYHAKDLDGLEELDVYMGDKPDEVLRDHPWYWEWTGSPPDPDYYRPEFTAPADHVQMYETVSEGTPVSPVFATKGQLAQWMVDELGYSEDAAAGFCESGWAPSGVGCATGYHDGITGLFEPGICGKGETDV